MEIEIAKAKQISDQKIMEEMKQRKLQWQAQKDQDFVRGKRRFLTNKERDLVIKTLGGESQKHISFDDIRKAVAENVEFREMFEELVNSEYEGSKVGRKKAEEAIRSSYRTFYRNFLDDHGGFFDEEKMANDDSQYLKGEGHTGNGPKALFDSLASDLIDEEDDELSRLSPIQEEEPDLDKDKEERLEEENLNDTPESEVNNTASVTQKTTNDNDPGICSEKEPDGIRKIESDDRKDTRDKTSTIEYANQVVYV